MEAAQKPPEPEPPTGSDELSKMSFGDHLEELRRRLFLSLIATGICVFALLPFKETVTGIYTQPYRDMWLQGFEDWVETIDGLVAEGGGREAMLQDKYGPQVVQRYDFLHKVQDDVLSGDYPFEKLGNDIRILGGYEVPYALVATKPIEDFWTFMAASFLFSLLIAGPFVVYQAWAFIAAGLYKHERSVALRFVPGAAILLVMGVAFGYLVVVPYALYFLVGLMNFSQVQPLISVSTYFSLLFMLTAALGIVFQLPLVMLALHKVGVVRHEVFVKNWRYVILILFALAAMFTPPDPFTMLMMGLPMLVLYAFGLWLTGRASKREKKLDPAAAGGDQ